MALTYELPTGSKTRVGDAARSLLGERLAGRDPATAAKFREMDEATGQGAADMRATAYQTMGSGGATGHGTARRNLQTTEQGILEQVAKNKLDQAQVAGTQQNQALAAGLQEGGRESTEKLGYLDRLQRNSADTGDAVTQGALQRLFLTGAGSDYTEEGNVALQGQARQQAELDRVAREREDEAYNRMRRNSAPQPWWKKAIAGAAGGASAGSSLGPQGAVGGGIVGGLAGLFA